MVPHSPPKVHKTYTKTTPRKRIGISVSRKNPIPLKITKDEKKPDPYIEHFRQEIQSSNFDSQLTKDTFKEGFAQARNKYVNVHHTTPSIYPLKDHAPPALKSKKHEQKKEFIDIDDEEDEKPSITPSFNQPITPSFSKKDKLQPLPLKTQDKSKIDHILEQEEDLNIKKASDIDVISCDYISVNTKRYSIKQFQFQNDHWKFYLAKSGSHILILLKVDEFKRFYVCFSEKCIMIQMNSFHGFLIEEYNGESDYAIFHIQNDEFFLKSLIIKLRSFYPKINEIYKEISSVEVKNLSKVSHKIEFEHKAPKRRKKIEDEDYEKESDEVGEIPVQRFYNTRRSGQRVVEIDDSKDSSSSHSSRNKILFVKNSITITEGDLLRLKPGEFLNDNILDFYVTYLKETLPDETKDAYFFNTHFWPLLNKDKDRVGKRFPKNEKIFDKKFVFIPINEHAHWTMVVICYPNNIQEKEKEKDFSPRLFYFDSLGNTSKGHVIFGKIRNYLKIRYAVEKGADKQITAKEIPGKSPKLPTQPNSYDCGVYLLHYMENFILDPPSASAIDKGLENWFEESDIKKKRERIEGIFMHEKIEYEKLNPNANDVPLTNDSNDSLEIIEQIPLKNVIRNEEKEEEKKEESKEDKDLIEEKVDQETKEKEILKENDIMEMSGENDIFKDEVMFKDEISKVQDFVTNIDPIEKNEKKDEIQSDNITLQPFIQLNKV